MAQDFTATAELVETLRYEAETGEISQGMFDAAMKAADLIERQADRINHLTNINEGLRETLDDQRKGLAELREMIVVGKSA